jgi:NADPH:quinone reductase-like Zn-dependent oxidoreductase
MKMNQMNAIVWTRYGPPEVLQLQEKTKPAPKKNEVLIRVHATTVTAGDCEFRSLQLPLLYRLPVRLYAGLTRPTRLTVLGQEFAGEVEAVGDSVTSFAVGDRVFGPTGFTMGAYAEYLSLPQDAALATIPAPLSYEEAAALPVGGLEALHFLRGAKLQPGEKVLINGAGGSIGTFALQLARHFGADVTAVDSADKLEMLRSLGAADVVDYTREDFSKRGVSYDVIFDVVGKGSFFRSIRTLKPHGRYLMANPGLLTSLAGRLLALTGDKQIVRGPASHNREDLRFLAGLLAGGVLKTIIDRRYPLAQTAAAHSYVETGQKLGNVVIVVTGEDR